ncbi:Neurogenic locus notch -like protein 1 [Trichinella zimbabwensis]|uniref:Neurogenic locus notch-like protein 1 n=1 Tax=Trichinella zimbabwensis TaxID=268475 RepID=A0A0V1HXB0_9BILA|nr:Neurogenic locus notch -like protein 1 [Trichinella zimbabwensis]
MEDSDNSALAEMGFPPHHIDLARQITGSSDIQVLCDWLMANSLTLNEADKGETAVEQKLLEEMKSIEERHQVGDFGKMDSQQAKTEANLDNQPEKKATYMKCNDCGRLLSSQKAMKQHSLEFNHCNFSEVEDAVAEEEKKKATENLYTRMQEMAKHREEKEQRKEIEVEKERRKMGLEMADYRRRLELEEMKQMIKQRKQQKHDDYLAKKRILDEIRMDREARQLQKNKAASASEPSSSSLSSSVGKMEKTSTGDDLETCTLQFRMPNGRKTVKEFKKTDTWANAKLFAETFFKSEHLEYFTTFPTRFFNEEDMSKTLLDMNFNLKIEIDANRSSTVSPWRRQSAYCFLALLCFFNKNYLSAKIMLFHSQKSHLHHSLSKSTMLSPFPLLLAIIFYNTFLIYSMHNYSTLTIEHVRQFHKNRKCEINLCANGGNCFFNEHGNVQCECTTGYVGKYCQTVDICMSNPCENGGSCDYRIEEDEIVSFTCLCPPGFTSRFCENPLPNVCDSLPCKNGICELETLDSFHCRCESGYEGKFCENFTPCKYNFCNNGGQCIVLPDATYRCVCPKGFAGSTCESDIDECLRDICEHGKCTNLFGDYHCACDAGFAGKNCDQVQHSCSQLLCNNNGNCVETATNYRCSCFPGFTGVRCEVEHFNCQQTICANGGVCVIANGTSKCLCTAPYTGATCGTGIDSCFSNPCYNGGVCHDFNDHFTCACPAGITGKYCEISSNGCSADMCLNGGTCFNYNDTYSCSCPNGIVGRRCQFYEAGVEQVEYEDIVVVVLVEPRTFMSTLNEYLAIISSHMQINITLKKDELNLPKVYSWNSQSGYDKNSNAVLFNNTDETEYNNSKFLIENEAHAIYGTLAVMTIGSRACTRERSKSCVAKFSEVIDQLASDAQFNHLKSHINWKINTVNGNKKLQIANFLPLNVTIISSLVVIIFFVLLMVQRKRLHAATWHPPVEEGPVNLNTTLRSNYLTPLASVLQNSTTDKKATNDAQKIFLKSKEDSCCTTDSQTADQMKRNATSRDTYKWSDLHLCIIHGVLVDPATITDDQLNAPGPDDETPLMVAAERCTSDVELQFMIMLLNAGANMEAQTELLKETALIIAVRHSRLQAVLALINFGCSLETADIDGNTALHHAVMTRNTEILCALLDSDLCNTETRNNDGLTPFVLNAKVCGSVDTEIAFLLLSSGASIDSTDYEGERYLFLFFFLNAEYFREKHSETVEWLLQVGGSMLEMQDHQMTPMSVCIPVDDGQYASFTFPSAPDGETFQCPNVQLDDFPNSPDSSNDACCTDLAVEQSCQFPHSSSHFVTSHTDITESLIPTQQQYGSWYFYTTPQKHDEMIMII